MAQAPEQDQGINSPAKLRTATVSEYTTEAPPPATIVQTLASENLNIFELFVPCLNSFEGVLPFSGFKTLQVCDSTFVIQHGELQGGSGLP